MITRLLFLPKWIDRLVFVLKFYRIFCRICLGNSAASFQPPRITFPFFFRTITSTECVCFVIFFSKNTSLLDNCKGYKRQRQNSLSFEGRCLMMGGLWVFRFIVLWYYYVLEWSVRRIFCFIWSWSQTRVLWKSYWF